MTLGRAHVGPPMPIVGEVGPTGEVCGESAGHDIRPFNDERWRRDQSLDGRADLFSCGAVHVFEHPFNLAQHRVGDQTCFTAEHSLVDELTSAPRLRLVVANDPRMRTLVSKATTCAISLARARPGA